MRFAARLLALPAALVALAATPSDPLDRVAAANGHAARMHVRATATRVVDGRRVSLTYDQRGELRLLRRCVADSCGGIWFDGRRAAPYGLNEVALPEDGDPLLPLRRTLAAIVSYDFAEPAFRAAGGSVDADGPDRWRVRALGGALLDAELDPASLAVRTVRDESGDVIATYRHEVRVDGATFALERRGLDEYSYDAATAAAGTVEPPAGVTATFGGDERLALGDDPVPIVPCSLAGRPARCLFDTGATPSAITLPFAETLGLEPRGELEIAGFSRFATGYVESGPLALGGTRFAHARFAVIPAVRSAQFDIVVGADLLDRLHVLIDRAHGIAHIAAPGSLPASDAVPLRFAAGVPRVVIGLDGAPTDALLDTGDASAVSLGYAAYRHGPQWPLAGRTQASGVGGGTDAFVVALPSLRIGAADLGPTRVTVSRTQDDVHLGIGIAARCVVDLDEAGQRFRCAAPKP